MKKILSLLFLAALTVGLLGSCSKINERIDGLDKRINNLENDKIASVEQQIAAINQSIADLGTIRTNIQTLIEAKAAQGEDIAKLKAANQNLEGEIAEIKAFLDTDLAKFATTEWVNATFATLEKQAEIIADVTKLKQDLAGLDAELDQAIEDLDSSLKAWVNEQLSAYSTTAQMEAKIKAIQDQIDALKTDNETNKSDIEDLEAGLAELVEDLASAKAAIKTAYEKAIEDALKSNNGYITEKIKRAISSVNGDISDLDTRVTTLEGKVQALEGKVGKLLAMVQSVSIIPAYSDGSVKAVNGILEINFIVNPASAVEGLTKKKVKILLNNVATKAVNIDTVKVEKITDFTTNVDNGTVKITADINGKLPSETSGTALTVAVNVSNDISDYTTKFVPVYEMSANVSTIAAANEALKTKNVVNIESPSDAGTNNTIIIPSAQGGKDVSITVSGVSERDITIKDEAEGTGAANLNIASDSKNLTIDTPQTHVDLTKGNFETVTATTSATTLVVGKDVKIEHLDITKGNVEIHGKVTNLTRGNGVKAKMYASDRATLINYINWAKPGDIAGLECDIDLKDENWTPLRQGNNRFDATFDGKGYSISNMTVSVDWGYGAGFFSDMSGVAKNFTIDNASVANTVADKGNIYGIVAGYAYGNVTFENITVTGSKIHAFGKVGGILGCAADPNGTTVVKNCKVEDTQIIGCYNVANYVGLLQNAIVLEGCTSTNVTKSIGGRYGEDSYVTFDNVKVINNDTENPKYVLSSGKYWKYVSGSNIYYYSAFADCYNDIHYDGWKALDGTVDGLVFNTPETPQPIDLEPVATIGTTKYYDLPSALAALQQGETLEIWQAGEYAVQTLSAPSNSIIEAKVDGVVFNRTAGGWVAAQTENVKTVKNITWNVGNGSYQYFSNTNLENCTVNGILFTHMTNKFKDCTFINEEGYNFWVYGNVYTEFDNCTFTCPGKNDGAAGCGSALNCYNESAQTPTPVLVVKNCTFTAKEASNKYSAIYVKPQTAFDIRITNSTCNDKFFTGAISGSKLWNLTADREGTTVTIDDVLVYPFCSKDADGNYHITNADGLLQFRDLYDAGKVAHTAKVYIENDIDFTGKTWNACEWHADKTTKGFALFDGQNHTIKNFTVSGQGMFSRWACTANIGATPYFKDIVFDGAKNVTSDLNVSLFCGQTYQNAKIENVTIKNSQIEGTYKVAPFVGTVYDENAGRTVTLTLKDCKVENTTVRSTKYNYCTCGMVAWVSDIDDKDKIVFEGNNVVKDVTLYKSNVSYNLFGKIYWGDGGDDGVAHDEAANVTVSNVNIVPVQ